MHSEHIVATKVLMPVCVCGGGGCLGKCTLSTLLLQKCSCPWGGGVRESVLCDIYGEEHYFENKLGPHPPLQERALCDIYGEEHYFENNWDPPP